MSRIPSEAYEACMARAERAGMNFTEYETKRVVHGKWEDEKIISAGSLLRHTENLIEHRCSHCSRWSVRFAFSIEDEYCPMCGAKMDLKEEK